MVHVYKIPAYAVRDHEDTAPLDGDIQWCQVRPMVSVEVPKDDLFCHWRQQNK